MAALALQQAQGSPPGRSYLIAHQIADRFGPQIAAAYLSAISRLVGTIDEAALISALASGSLDEVMSAIAPTRLQSIFLGGDSLADTIRRTSAATGRAGADVVSGATGFSVQFNAVDIRVVLWAREHAAALVTRITEDVREAVRIVLATGAAEGLTVVQQARAIRTIVGLRVDHAQAVLNLVTDLRLAREGADELVARALGSIRRRRLDAVTKARLSKAVRAGTITDETLALAESKYGASLRNWRGLSIARTEGMVASNHGLRESWRQALKQGALPATARRVVVVTPDERLRETHAEAQRMNMEGVGIEEPFETPWGPLIGPPWAADPVHCRCGESLTFPGLRGAL